MVLDLVREEKVVLIQAGVEREVEKIIFQNLLLNRRAKTGTMNQLILQRKARIKKVISQEDEEILLLRDEKMDG